MKLLNILPLAALSAAFVIPDEQVMSEAKVESRRPLGSVADKLPSKDQATKHFENTFSKLVDSTKSSLDQAIDLAAEAGEEVSTKAHEKAFDAQAWLEVRFSSQQACIEKSLSLRKHGLPYSFTSAL